MEEDGKIDDKKWTKLEAQAWINSFEMNYDATAIQHIEDLRVRSQTEHIKKEIAEYDKNRDNLNRRFGNKHYKPNEGGFFELSKKDYSQPHFPSMYEGKLIKVLMPKLPYIVAGNYNIIFMLRNVEDIANSYLSAFKVNPPLVGKDLENFRNDILSAMSQRKDCNIITVDYDQVLDDPLKFFQDLKQQGWDIDASKAASVIKKKYTRWGRHKSNDRIKRT